MTQIDSWQGATILASTDDELVGKTLNDTYAVERLLGEGGMGRVYLARHTRIQQKRVAVKVLHREFVRNAEVLARFQREAETAASISHPNVVAVYDVDCSPHGLPYLVSEYLEGIDLGQHLKQVGKLDLMTAIHIARQLCDGLAVAHRCGVIHRDLKPSNIFLVGDFSAGVPELPFVKILDFGLSKFMDPQYQQLVTAAGMIMGTPAFMPPEQAQGESADHRSDIYGVGALLYTFLTGKRPFDEPTPQATVLAVIGSEPPRPRTLEPKIPKTIEQVILRAMAKNPEARYPDMAALIEALAREVEDSKRAPYLKSSRPSLAPALETQSSPLKAPRPHLVATLVLALSVLLGSTAVALAGFEQVWGWALNRRELGLVMLCGSALAVTPTILLIRWIRLRVWNDSERVTELSLAARTAVITAASAYGLVWLASRLFDGVILRLMGKPVRIDLAWPGWDFLLPLIAVGAGIVALLRERALRRISIGWRRGLIAALALCATVALVAFVIPMGLHWQEQQVMAKQPRTKSSGKAKRSDSGSSGAKPTVSSSPAAALPFAAEAHLPAQAASADVPTAGAVIGSAEPLPAVERDSVLPDSTPSAAVTAPPPTSSPHPSTASPDELRTAAADGVEGWVRLHERYPADAHVLKSLVLAHASRAADFSKAMAAMQRLFQIDPEQATDTDLQYLVLKATEARGPASELAWQMVANDMGTIGPDLLYQLTLTKPKLAARAERLLRAPQVQSRITPALAIAREIRQAPSCAARLPLLDRAIEHGDERASAALGALSTATSHGCGRGKRKPCPAACPEEAERFRSAMGRIVSRSKTEQKLSHQ